MSIGQMIRNAFTARVETIRQLLGSSNTKDIEGECGHPTTITIDDYEKAFLRGDVAGRIVRIFPEESWNDTPSVYETEDEEETEFEKAWKELEEKHHIYSYLQRVDVLSGVGRYGVLLLGFDDGLDLHEPLEGVTEDLDTRFGGDRELLYLRPFNEGLVRVDKFVGDVTNPRYGQPELYSLQLHDSDLDGAPLSDGANVTLKVHWTRVIHVADNRASSDVFGCPRLELVFNRFLDLKKVAGGSGEMFWKGGFPGYSLETNPGMEEDVEIDEEATKEQMLKYMMGLQRYIATTNMQVKSLSVQIADPRPHIEVQIRLISIALGIPWRIFMGVEVGQLASDQDMKNWNKRITRRRENYLTPLLIRPLVDRLIQAGVLPEPGEDGVQVDWPDISAPSDEDKANVAEKRTNAITKYASTGADMVIPPFHYLTLILGLSEDEANGIIEAAEEHVEEVEGSEAEQAEAERAQALEDEERQFQREAELAARANTPAPAIEEE